MKLRCVATFDRQAQHLKTRNSTGSDGLRVSESSSQSRLPRGYGVAVLKKPALASQIEPWTINSSTLDSTKLLSIKSDILIGARPVWRRCQKTFSTQTAIWHYWLQILCWRGLGTLIVVGPRSWPNVGIERAELGARKRARIYRDLWK